MDMVKFISIEDDDPDLVLSFALDDEGFAVKSLILLRTPAFESLLPSHERGVDVSMEGDDEFEDNLLKEIILTKDKVTVVALYKSYELDTSRVEKDELEEMLMFIEKLNFDSCFKVSRK